MIIQISTHFDVRYGHDPVILIKMPYYNVTMMLLQDIILTKAALLSLSPVSYFSMPALSSNSQCHKPSHLSTWTMKQGALMMWRLSFLLLDIVNVLHILLFYMKSL